MKSGEAIGQIQGAWEHTNSYLNAIRTSAHLTFVFEANVRVSGPPRSRRQHQPEAGLTELVS